jgi:PAS domain S-box-containing protein
MSQDQQPPGADELLKLLFEQTREQAVMLLDPAGRIIGWYGGAEHAFGYLPHEVLGQPVSILFTPENLAAGMDEYEQAVARTDIEAEDDRWMLRKDGARFWATGVLSPIRNSGGQLIAFGKILRNRTDMRAKTEALVNDNEKLKDADERKNHFISTLAHELRNPLAGLVNAVELIKAGGANADALELAAETMDGELKSMRRLVDDLLDMTRVNAGKIQLQTKRQDLRPIVESAMTACRSEIDERRQTLHYFMPEAPLLVEVDEVRMRQVYANLIQNAANFTRDGGTIWVKVSLEDDEAVVKVEDNGIGISPDALPHIFELFTQAETQTERKQPGLGIGLSVVQDLTRLHGGSVQVRSDGIGKGSEFTVRMPLAEGIADPSAAPAPRQANRMESSRRQ